MHRSHLIAVLLPLLVAALQLAPAQAQEPSSQPSLAPDQEPSGHASLTSSAGLSYTLGAGDAVEIEVYGEKDLCGSFPVYEGGFIDYPLVGKVQVQGLTVPALADALREQLAQRFLVDPHVTVRIDSYSSQPVQVLGAVAKPGVFYLEGHTTVRQILALAGGIIAENAVKEVRVERRAGDGREVVSLKLDSLLADGENDITLQAGDVVNVVEGMVVYVSGEVKESGTVPYWDGLTVTRALAEAGGPDTYAKLRRAYVLRDGQRIVFNLKRLLQGRDVDIVLRPGDQLVIEESMF
jgi:protein involved in polysaccharide export with SLBB domain